MKRHNALGRYIQNTTLEIYIFCIKENFFETVARNRLNVHAHLNLQINPEHREMDDISAHARHPVSRN